MKERADANYMIDIDYGEGAVNHRLYEFFPSTYSVIVNGLVQVVLLPVLCETPWPPPFPVEFDQFRTQEEAARYVLATTQVVVAPRSEPVIRRETVVYDQLSEMVHNAIWIPRQDYEDLALDLERLLTSEWSTERRPRLSDLEGRPLARFLKSELPRVVLSDYEREILKIQSEPAHGESSR